MSRVERVRDAIYFNGPDRVPKYNSNLLLTDDGDIGVLLPFPSQHWQPGHKEGEEGLFPHPGMDIAITTRFMRWKKPDWAKEWAKKDPRYKGINWLKTEHEEVDSWGAIWNRSGRMENMGHPGRPSLPDWSKYEEYMEKYRPDASDKTRYIPALMLKKLFGKKKYRMSHLGFGVKEQISYIRGISNWMMDHRRHPQELKRMLEDVADYYLDVMKYSFKYGLDPHGFYIIDEWGEQQGPFINPKTFEKFYEPLYNTLIEAAHDLKCEFHLHSCGNVPKVIPNLIKCGLDAIQFDSPRMNNYNDLKPFRGKIMFWGCVNIQSIYPNGTPEECEREVWHMMRNLGTKDGGFGAFFYPQPRDIKAPKENISAFASGLKKYGNYSEIPEWWWDAPIPSIWKDYVVPPLPTQ